MLPILSIDDVLLVAYYEASALTPNLFVLSFIFSDRIINICQNFVTSYDE